MLMKARTLLLASMVALIGTSQVDVQASTSAPCPNMTVSEWGVIDYRTVDRARLQLVERYHFTPDIEQLNSHRSAADLSYTLNRFQNHHRALMSLMNLALRERTSQPKGAAYPLECYLGRAEHLFPDDATVRMIHGLYLLRTDRISAAVSKLESARELNVDDANLQYNLGLAYVRLGQYDKALESAHRAYGLGFPLPGLRNQLQRVGRWRDLPAAQPEVALPHEGD